MTLKKAKIVFGIIAIAIIALGCGLGIPLMENAKPWYSGREIFYTEAEYVQFKEALVDGQAHWIDMDVLSSKPPVIVDFDKVSVEKGFDFPYGEEHHYSTRLLFISIAVVIVFAYFAMGCSTEKYIERFFFCSPKWIFEKDDKNRK